MPDSLWPHGLKHANLLCPSISPGVCSNSRPLSQRYYPTISFSCLQLFTALGSFPMSWLCIRWPKYWSFSFIISPCNEYSGLISFRIEWFHLLAFHGTLKSLLQHHSSKASISSALSLMVQLSHPYMNTGKAIALIRWTFVSKVISLLFIRDLGLP